MITTTNAAASIPERTPSLVERLRVMEAALRGHAEDADGMGGLAAEDIEREGCDLSSNIVDVADEMAQLALEMAGPPQDAPPGPARSGLPRLAALARAKGVRAPVPPWQRGRR